MGQTLTNGIYLPDEGERNSYSGLEANWRTLDALILTVNGKAAPNVANTWTAAQTFTAGIAGDLTGNVTGNVTGDLTGTAAKAIADEDGTSIKTGYVNVAGNQTVSGQKTWSGNQFFTSAAYHNHASYESGNIPTNNSVTNIYLADKNSVYLGYLRNVVYTSGRTATEIRAKNTFKNGVLDPTGSDITSNFNVEVQPSGAKTVYWDGLIRNDVTPFTTNSNSLGSSTNQWSSVYAQSYYYNGAEFSSKFVTTDTDQSIAGLKTIATAGSPQLRVKSTSIDLTNTAVTSYRTISIRAIDKNDTTLGQISWNYKASDNTGRLNLVQTSRDAVTGGIIIQHNGSNSTTDIMPYDTTNAHNLGTSTNKWKTLNGVNPGALSLPDYSRTMNIDTTNWSKAGGMIVYTPTFDGWLQITIPNDDNDQENKSNMISILDSGTEPLTGFSVSNILGPRLYFLYPVRASRVYWLYIKSYSNTITTARIVQCQGNV